MDENGVLVSSFFLFTIGSFSSLAIRHNDVPRYSYMSYILERGSLVYVQLLYDLIRRLRLMHGGFKDMWESISG